MIDQEQAAICRIRGHKLQGPDELDRWKQCQCCHTWVRERRVLDEREDTPPKEEISIFHTLFEKQKKP
jgi:hypothetical protein